MTQDGERACKYEIDCFMYVMLHCALTQQPPDTEDARERVEGELVYLLEIRRISDALCTTENREECVVFLAYLNKEGNVSDEFFYSLLTSVIR
jgi:hypothetical protein